MENPPLFMRKFIISMAIFHSYVKLPEDTSFHLEETSTDPDFITNFAWKLIFQALSARVYVKVWEGII